MANDFKKNEKSSFSATLSATTPKLITATNIEFYVANSVQEQDFEDHRQQVLDFLRTELKNYQISIVVIKQDQPENKSAYTDKEKLLLMMEKNPHIKTLVEELGLEPDF